MRCRPVADVRARRANRADGWIVIARTTIALSIVGSLVGTRLGRFRITRLIGRGGMGEVYAAVDENLDRDVAVKVLSDAVNVEPHRRRFLREARLAARLNHPNIASVYEVGDSDGRLYIVMELLEGQTLRALLAERRLTIDESVSIARDIARALARAHARDIIHRDIKPENVVITHPGPDTLLAKVLDFGLAREDLLRKGEGTVPPPEPSTPEVAKPGEAFGSAGYLAPEQARGAGVGLRADVFSCGAVLFEMLTGSRAFDGRNQLARMLAVVKTSPPPLRTRAPDVGPELERIVARGLAKDPADRFADGAALLGALDGVARASLGMMSTERGALRSEASAASRSGELKERGALRSEASAASRSGEMQERSAPPEPPQVEAYDEEVEDTAPPSVRSSAPREPGPPARRGAKLWPAFALAGLFTAVGTLLVVQALVRRAPPAVASPMMLDRPASDCTGEAAPRQSVPGRLCGDTDETPAPSASSAAAADAAVSTPAP